MCENRNWIGLLSRNNNLDIGSYFFNAMFKIYTVQIFFFINCFWCIWVIFFIIEETRLLIETIFNIKSITYFIISDDITWCKKVFANLPNAVFVEQEKTKNGYASDMWLLSLCDHVVISNSTFAWWGAYLGEKQDSIICAPEMWAKKKSFIPDNIVPERWVKVTNTFEV